MKKSICLIIPVVLCLLLCACDPGMESIGEDALDDVVGVDLIRYDNPKQREFASWVPDHTKQLKSFDPDKVTVLETLPEDNIPALTEALSQAEILDSYFAYDSPRDVCLRLTHKDGSFLIAWANYEEGTFGGYVGEYAPDGSVLTFLGSFEALSAYTDLVDGFFAYHLG